MKASQFYLSMATQLLAGVEKDYKEIVKCGGDMESLDHIVRIASPLQAAVDGIIEGVMEVKGSFFEFDYLADLEAERLSLEMDGVDYKEYILYDTDRGRGDFPNDIAVLRAEIPEDKEREAFIKIVVTAISEMHDHWRRMNVNLFLDPRFQDRQFMFMQVDLIGWREVEKYFDIIQPILVDLGIESLCTKDDVKTVFRSRHSRLHRANIVRREIDKNKRFSQIVCRTLDEEPAVFNRIVNQVLAQIR